MVKQYAITDRDTWLAHVDTFHPAHGSHYIDLEDAMGNPTGKLLVAVAFYHDGPEDAFFAHPLVDRLPHPVFEGNVPIDPEKHARPLKDHLFSDVPIGAQRLNAARAATVLDVARRAAKLHPLMRLSAL
jgi:hypothetical protein